MATQTIKSTAHGPGPPMGPPHWTYTHSYLSRSIFMHMPCYSVKGLINTHSLSFPDSERLSFDITCRRSQVGSIPDQGAYVPKHRARDIHQDVDRNYCPLFWCKTLRVYQHDLCVRATVAGASEYLILATEKYDWLHHVWLACSYIFIWLE